MGIEEMKFELEDSLVLVVPPSICTLIAETVSRVEITAASLQGFVEGKELADHRWKLEITAARLMEVP